MEKFLVRTRGGKGNTNGKRKATEAFNKDPYDLESRYVRQQQTSFDGALQEINNGHKCSCWM